MKSSRGSARRDQEPANDRCPVNNLVTDDFPIAQGKVDGTLVSALRDTSCNGMVIKPSLVSDDDELTVEIDELTLLDKLAIGAPMVRITSHTSFYRVKLKLFVFTIL